MAKLDDAVAAATRQMKARRIPVDEKLLRSICKSLGPSLYNRDSRTVAAGDPKELATIKKNFLIKKLGCKDGPELDKAMNRAIKKIGKSNRAKNRAVFYYILVKDQKKEKKFK